ncbi:MAG TPA: hypothetical protein PKX15_10615 [Bacteroidales bacterium]|nr:hypothetical protein [Bacteroidales bacterium]
MYCCAVVLPDTKDSRKPNTASFKIVSLSLGAWVNTTPAILA